MSLGEIERRLRVLEDIEEIKKLKARYCAYADDGFDADGLAGLFVEDGVWEGRLGRNQGREAIWNFFVGAGKRMSFALHYVLNPVITVDGDQADGSWYVFELGTLVEGNRAFWLAGRYTEEYVRVDGEWKFRSLRLDTSFITPFDQGWAKQPFI